MSGWQDQGSSLNECGSQHEAGERVMSKMAHLTADSPVYHSPNLTKPAHKLPSSPYGRQRPIKKHDPWIILEAASRVKARELTLRKASELYNIPRSTISDYVTGKIKKMAFCAL